MTQRLAVDIGGTFVDAIVFDQESGTTNLEKASTTPDNPTNGVIDSIEKAGAKLEDTDAFVHGTTLGINAFIEREGAKTGIITNEGFRDIFEIGRCSVPRENMYDIKYEKPSSLVPRQYRAGVPCRLDAEGAVVGSLDEDAVHDAAERLVEEQGVESIAICYLHSYLNQEHEKRTAEIIQNAYPSVEISRSSDITSEYREYERTSTTVLDSYIKPVFKAYADKLETALTDRGFDGSFFITRSGGGVLQAETAKTAPIQTILSGPAGGLIGASRVAEETNRDNLIAADMGGTSIDTCVIEEGSPAIEYESTLETFPIMIPVYDIRTIGAGGGSITWLDGDILKVGPKSAGADPGPICYGQGGTEPTVTDVALELGYLDPEAFLGGEMELDAEGAHEGIKEKLAEPLNRSTLEVSKGVFDVTAANTIRAIREITVERGLDPRDFSMLTYGGAGPMFLPLVAREMNVEEVIVPHAPSVFSAWGMLQADNIHDFSQTYIHVLDEVEMPDLEDIFEDLEEDATTTLTDGGISPDDQQLVRTIDMRYAGQEHSVEVNADDANGLEELETRFEQQHENRYGHTMGDPAQLVSLRVRGIGRHDKPTVQHQEDRPGKEAAYSGTRTAYCFAEEDTVDFSVYEREPLATGDVVSGPAVVREPTTTVVFYSDQDARVDDSGRIAIKSGDSNE